MEDEHVNLFKYEMTEQEQIDLSDALNDFVKLYENGFDGLIGDVNEDEDYFLYEFKELYNIVYILIDKYIKNL